MLNDLCSEIINEPFVQWIGRVNSVRKNAIRTSLPNVRVGSICEIETDRGFVPIEIVSLDVEGHIAMPLDELSGVRLGDRVVVKENSATVQAGDDLLGRVVDSMCVPYEEEPMNLPHRISLYGGMTNPLERSIIEEPLDLGIRSINTFLTCGRGQRQGIFSGSGVGKSVLLGMMARFTQADVVVIGLIGERGREVREFIERDLGPEGLKKSVVVVETSDRSAVRRVRGAYTAAAICEYFRSREKHVLFLVDSLTRFAMAQREIGIAAGEPPTTKGYPPSVWGRMASLVERAGNWGAGGTITGLFTVLVEGDDLEDPVADASRALLDGHIVLSRRLAQRGQFPAVDILASVSRVMDQVVTTEHRKSARTLQEQLARYQENEDAIQYGMYVRGSDLSLDACIEKEPKIRAFLRQERGERVSLEQCTRQMMEL